MIGASGAISETPFTYTTSDHAEIALQWAGRIINTWNIRGKDLPSAANQKIAAQISTIAERFAKRKVGIQVIIGGDNQFYTELTERIIFEEHAEFSLIKFNSDKSSPTGIVVDREKFSILVGGTVSERYKEEEKTPRELILPYAQLLDLSSKRRLIVIGVHITTHSKSCLNALATILTKLHEKTEGKYDIIATGDFSSTPAEAKIGMSSFFDKGGSLLKIPYPTHLDNKNEAVEHDQIAFLGVTDSLPPVVLPETTLSKASQSLIYAMREIKLSPT